MAITKLIYQDDNEALLRSVERNGEAMVSLINTDRGIKSAASNLISKDVLEKYRPTDDNTACIHLIAMGNSDQYGFNKNGDWFSGDVLEKTAHTFVTNGHMFREHRNNDPKKAIGTIKYANYDPKGMQRVELIVHMDKDKAEEEYQMAKEGKDLSFSMSCRVPNDRCSICGNKAKTLPQYCDHLKHNMGKWIEKSAGYAYAYNDEPVFFDISRVANPADRIARHLEYMFKEAGETVKSASSKGDLVIPSALAAKIEGVNLDSFSLQEQNYIYKLASAEEYIKNLNNAYDNRSFACQSSYPFALCDKLSDEELTSFRSTNPGTLFNNLAKKACVLSFPAWCQYITGKSNITESPMFKKASLILPSIFGDMMHSINSIIPCSDCFSACSDYQASKDPKNDEIQNLMEQAEDKFSIKEEPVRKRVIRITITIGSNPTDNLEGRVKQASYYDVDTDKCVKLAQAYGQYQVKALSDISTYHDITDNMIDTIAGANTVLLFDR